MGAKLCSLRNSGAAAPPSDDDDDDCYRDERVGHSRSFLRRLKRRCLNLKTEKHKKMICQQDQESVGKKDVPTLEQWLLRSPSIEMAETTGSYSWGLSPKVCPLTITCCDESESGSSSSIQGAAATGDEPRSDRAVSRGRRRSRSERSVRFRSPEEADIHLIHSHYYESEE